MLDAQSSFVTCTSLGSCRRAARWFLFPYSTCVSRTALGLPAALTCKAANAADGASRVFLKSLTPP